MTDIIRTYFDCFNAGDVDGMLACLSDDVAHHVNEGDIRIGKDKFAAFCARMNDCYREELTDMVIFTAPDHSRAAAEYMVNGTYIATDQGLPEARGQTYRIPAGSFFDLRDGKISRVTTRYNLSDWIAGLMRVETLTGQALEDALDDVARLRISVFRDWPYLYDGDLSYEQRYLQSYRESEGAIVVGAFDGGRLVGASTGTPLMDHADDFAKAFAGSGLPLDDIFYGAESVLLPEYRGRGIGHRFFDLREDHARGFGFSRFCFCAVERPQDHPSRPTDYRPLDAFWRGRGYQPLEGVIAQFSWKDLGDTDQTPKPLQFWIKDL